MPRAFICRGPDRWPSVSSTGGAFAGEGSSMPPDIPGPSAFGANVKNLCLSSPSYPNCRFSSYLHHQCGFSAGVPAQHSHW